MVRIHCRWDGMLTAYAYSMGTEAGGNMFPGVAFPFGMAKVGPGECTQVLSALLQMSSDQ